MKSNHLSQKIITMVLLLMVVMLSVFFVPKLQTTYIERTKIGRTVEEVKVVYSPIWKNQFSKENIKKMHLINDGITYETNAVVEETLDIHRYLVLLSCIVFIYVVSERFYAKLYAK